MANISLKNMLHKIVTLRDLVKNIRRKALDFDGITGTPMFYVLSTDNPYTDAENRANQLLGRACQQNPTAARMALNYNWVTPASLSKAKRMAK